MGRDIQDAQNVDAPTADYPNGRIRDKAGATDGTVISEALHGDMVQFFSKLMRDANPVVTPNGLPDNETNGYQLFAAFINYVRNVLTATETAKGTVEKATTAEAQAGTADKYLDAALLQLVTSTTTRSGVVEKATTAEAQAGTSDKFIDADLMQSVNGKTWQTPSFNSGFTSNLSNPFQYRINRGKLEFRGSIDSASATNGVAFTLPLAYRPSLQAHITKFNETSGVVISQATIQADGDLYSDSWILSASGTNYFNASIILD